MRAASAQNTKRGSCRRLDECDKLRESFMELSEFLLKEDNSPEFVPYPHAAKQSTIENVFSQIRSAGLQGVRQRQKALLVSVAVIPTTVTRKKAACRRQTSFYILQGTAGGHFQRGGGHSCRTANTKYVMNIGSRKSV